MFTLEQLKAAHAKVKSGADFPRYIQDVIQFGVSSYETFVTDGHTVYLGKDGHNVESASKYDVLPINAISDPDTFKKDLKAHQQGSTNYPTFCSDCAKSGVEKWVVDTAAMSCTYYDLAGNMLLVETIPTV